MNKLKNLVVYVTGGASGIGKAVAERIACQGGQVCIADVNPEGCKIAKSLGENTLFCLTDVTQECDVMESLKSAKDCFGKINVIINSAGINRRDKIYDFKTLTPHCADVFKTQMDVNVWGTFNVTRLAAGILAENKADAHNQRGVIINLSSVMAYDASPEMVAYGASKAAIAGMTIPLSRGLCSKGIRVVGVAPGFIDSEMSCAETEESRKLNISMKLSPKRFGTCDEVAHLIQAIIENPIINGEVLRIDSGWRYSQVNDCDGEIESNC